jgi:hypothetical protein
MKNELDKEVFLFYYFLLVFNLPINLMLLLLK